ncbi:MAG: VOC family protein [Solirubrobacterales bacterium]|nr:VOC family protein [Solirubrobacterales bacterium]
MSDDAQTVRNGTGPADGTGPASGTRPGAGTRLAAGTRLGPVELWLAALERALDFYTGALGLQVRRRTGDGVAALGAGEEDLLVVHERGDARREGGRAGLYHLALLYPSREELAHALVRVEREGAQIQGASDHGTHEAIYLADPEGNGFELAADRPRERWISLEEEFARGGPRPLDLSALLATVEGEAPTPRAAAGLRVGHIHLHVGDIERGVRFYRDVVGFEPTAVMGSVAFLAAGDYHHHLALNTWRGSGVGPMGPDAAGLRRWTVLVGERRELEELGARARVAGLQGRVQEDGAVELVDPWAITVRVALGAGGAPGTAR